MKKTYMNPKAETVVMNASDIITASETLSVLEDIIVDNFGGAADGYEIVF